MRSHAKNDDTSTLNRDTLMIHFLAFLQEVSFFQAPIHQRIMPFSTPKDDTMILFRQKHFTCVRKWYFKECKKEGRFQHFFLKNNILSTFTNKDLVVTNNCCNFVAQFLFHHNNKE